MPGDHVGGLPFLVLDGPFRRRLQDLTGYSQQGAMRRT
jgi:hypothetical protein